MMANDKMLTPNDVELLQSLSERFEEGHYEGAVEVLIKLANQGSETAMLHLGWMYKSGSGVTVDAARAEDWLRRAARQGSPDTLYYLGRYLSSVGDRARGMDLLGQAVAGDYLPAQYELGRLLVESPAKDQDKQRGWELLEAAARQGHVFAKRKIASAMLRGRFGLLAVPLGAWMFVTGLWGAVRTGLSDPLSDKVR